VTDEDRELEDRLRALPTAGPPAALRERILTGATRRPRRRSLAFALCLLGLLALDLGVQQVQSARISRLIGGGSSSVAAGPNDLAAVMQQRAMIARLLRNGEMTR